MQYGYKVIVQLTLSYINISNMHMELGTDLQKWETRAKALFRSRPPNSDWLVGWFVE